MNEICTAILYCIGFPGLCDSNNENEETLENQNPTNIATDMHELIKPRTATDMDGTLPHWSLKSETSRDIKKSF